MKGSRILEVLLAPKEYSAQDEGGGMDLFLREKGGCYRSVPAEKKVEDIYSVHPGRA